MKELTTEKLIESINIALIHQKRLLSAYELITSWGHFDKDLYLSLDAIQIAITDQYVYRFAKLQDLVGEKIVKLCLDFLKENTERMPFIEILNKAQKIGLINDTLEWIELRESRNQIAHDYATTVNEIVDLFTDLLSKKDVLISYFEGITTYLSSKGLVINNLKNN